MMLSVIQDTDAGYWYMMPISVCWEKKNTEKRKIPGKEECREEEFQKKEYRIKYKKEYGIEYQKDYRITRYLFRYHDTAKR